MDRRPETAGSPSCVGRLFGSTGKLQPFVAGQRTTYVEQLPTAILADVARKLP